MMEQVWMKIISSYNDKSMQKVVLGFFVLYLMVGVLIFRDFGASSDENFERMTAQINLNYITGKDDQLLTYSDRHYGVLFTLPLELANPLFPDSRDYFFFRHIATFVFFYISTIVFYKLLRKLEYNRLMSLLGTAFLILQPTIFAHSFFNPKDIPFLSVFIAALYTLVNFIQSRSNKAAILHGIVTGILIVFRLPGVLMWGISGLMFAWIFLTRVQTLKQLIGKFGLYFLVSVLTLYALLPVLWQNPLTEMGMYLSMSPFQWDNEELFMGQRYLLTDLPLSHVFVYFGVSMPMVLLFLFGVAGVVTFKVLLVDQKLFDFDKYRMILAVTSLLLIVQVFAVFRPAVYNGWRHLFFVYPFFLLFVMEAIDWIWQGNMVVRLPIANFIRWLQTVLTALVVGQIILLLVFLAQSHPHQFAYYNWLAGRKLSHARLNYVMDYWGLSYRQAFEKILEKDDSAKLVVRVDDIVPASINRLLLPIDQRERLQLIEMGSVKKNDYMVLIYKNNLYTDREGYELVDSIYVREAIINGTYKVK